jgi:hypothetical protein
MYGKQGGQTDQGMDAPAVPPAGEEPPRMAATNGDTILSGVNAELLRLG